MGLIHDALIFAVRAHAGHVRKGTDDVPYIWHPLGVGRLLQDCGCPQEVIVAGILHDTVEDGRASPGEVAAQFGEEVSGIIRALTEDKSLAWEVRKGHTLQMLPTAPLHVRLVAAADKIDNLRSIANDLRLMGEKVWARFRRGKEQQEWYYRGVARAVAEGPGGDHPLIALLAREVESLFGPG